MDQVYSADGERELLRAQSQLRLWNFAAECHGSVDALNFNPALSGSRVALQSAAYPSCECQVGEGRRDRGTDNRLHPFRVLCVVWERWASATTVPKILNCSIGIFSAVAVSENFFHAVAPITENNLISYAGNRGDGIIVQNSNSARILGNHVDHWNHMESRSRVRAT
jgi:hypothetical protein